MSLPIISIIVPIYNTEKYLTECVESILNQTYTNVEIILVDNGSTDISPQICESFKFKDKRVKVVHKQHGSISSGRNAGLEIATGEYIAFVDSDDVLSNEIIEVLFNLAQQRDADICVCKAKRMYIDCVEELEETESVTEYDVPQALYAWQCAHTFGSEVWAKLYRRECIKNILFPEGTYEDVRYLFEAIRNSKKIAIVDKRMYYYRMHRTYEERNSYRRPVEDNKVQSSEEMLNTVRAEHHEIYPAMFGAFCNSILSSVMKIYAAKKVKKQMVFLDNAYSFFLRRYDEVKHSEDISERNKKIINLFLKHRKLFGLIFKIRNCVKE